MADDKIDTGTGGFPIDGKVQTYDVGVTSTTPSTVPYSPGAVSVDVGPKDVSVATKRTLADYLGKTTMGKTPSSVSSRANEYPVVHNEGSDPAVMILNDPTTGRPIGPQIPVNEKRHAVKYVPGDERSATFETAKTNTGTTGHKLLKDFMPLGPRAAASRVGFSPPFPEKPTTAPAPGSPINEYYGSSEQQLSNSVIFNRFNTNNRFEDYSGGGKNIGVAQFAASYTLGQSMAPEDPRRSITYGRLAQIGNALSVRSGLELNSTVDRVNPTGGSMQAGALLPGFTQLGIRRIERDRLNASSVIDTLTSENIKNNLLVDPAALSWGSLNNVQDQFSGISNFGMQLLAAALVIGLGLVFTVFGLLLMIPVGNQMLKVKDDNGRRPYGAYRGSESGGDYSSIAGIISSIIGGGFNIWRLLGLTPTSNKMDKCMAVGGLSFFGVNDASAGLGTFALKATLVAPFSVIKSPGYYAIMARNVSRSFLLIADSFSSLSKAFGSGLTAGIKQLLEIIDVLRSSKFLRAIDIFCRLGDMIISMSSIAPEKAFDKTDTQYKRFKSAIDINENGEAVRKSRLNATPGVANPLTLAWAAHRAPDALVMPSSILAIRSTQEASNLDVPHLLKPIGLNNNGGRDGGGIKLGPHVVLNSSAQGRIDTETREKVEDALEAEYVPFYIQDVRTNEILSFHAFLASLTDDYTASYDSIEGFGRVEGVKVYKSTGRKIGFSFYLAATNPDDFDYMWLKINKLTTMVYPQFSEGRSIVLDKSTLQVPFSQTIQASPLVRVRIGDLIKSNYSKFNLARLFGLGSKDSSFEGQTMSDSGKVDQATYDKKIQAAFTVGAKLLLNSGQLGSPVPKPSGIGVPVPIPAGKGIVPTKQDSLPPGFVLQVDKIEGDDFICTVKEATGLDAVHLTKAQKEEMKNYKGAAGDDKNIFEKTYKIKKKDLTLSPSEMKKLLFNLEVTTAEPYVKNAVQFMDDNPQSTTGNAVSRSFRSSGGKGLAGFIESLSFDWYDRVTWEIGRGIADEGPKGGRRAPKMCKITVSFSPIHDITPGLDHMGFNRAPIYPVGPYSFNDMRSRKG